MRDNKFVDVIDLLEFLDNRVNPFKWINEIFVYDDTSKKFYKLKNLCILNVDNKEECMVLEFDKFGHRIFEKNLRWSD